jgi:gluconolactonase
MKTTTIFSGRFAPFISTVCASILLAMGTATNAHGQTKENVVAPGATLQLLGDGFKFTEGPAADKEGNVYFTDQPNDRIMRWSVDGKISEWLKPAGRANGTYFDAEGNLLACADEQNQLWLISTDKKVSVLITNYNGKLLNGPNDLWIRRDGNLYFTDPLYKRDYWKRDPASQQPGQHVYFLNRKTGEIRPVATDLKQPNGLIGTPDNKTLYVADIGAGKTYSYSIQENGDLTDKKLLCNLGSDGMTLDEEGNVYLTGRGVTVFNKEGQEIAKIPVPKGWTANVTFGGKDRKLLFITASDAVYGMQMRVRGAF